MSDLLIRLITNYLLKMIQMPVLLLIEFQRVNLRFRETQHLLRLDAYLLRDMGLRKVGNRIEAIDASRIKSEFPPTDPTKTGQHREHSFRRAN
ncbi:MAG: hypothetical protein AAF353_21485 [Pseudomonadota bacterium]